MRRIVLAFCLAAVAAAAQAQDADQRGAKPGHDASQNPPPAATSAPAHHTRTHHVTVAVAPPEAAPAAAIAPLPAVLHEMQRRSHGRISQCVEGRRIITAYYAEGRRTANGERFNPNGLTAAHRTLPFGTKLKVINPRTGQSVLVRVNDRGPFVRGVTLDLSVGAAKAIGMHGTGAVCLATM